jgi:hypothetical protein
MTVFGFLGGILSSPFKAIAKVGLSVTSGWIVAGAQAILAEVVKVIGLVSTPSLTASWFSSSYWRIAGLAMLLTVPFLFAAAVQAVVRTDLGVLLRAAFIDLPVAVLAVTLTAPVVALLLAATDEMCAAVTGGGAAGGSFLSATGVDLGSMRSSFMLVVIAVVIMLAGLVLMVELIMRAAAIYIVVLFLPLGFAAMVWPARRIWIKRMVELLVALILSKFAMVAVLSLAVSGVASLGPSPTSLTTALTAMALMVLAAFSPWALLRLLPFTEIAAGAGSMLHQQARQNIEPRQLSGQGPVGVAEALVGAPVPAGVDALRQLVQNGPMNRSGHAGDGSPTQPALTPSDAAGDPEATGDAVARPAEVERSGEATVGTPSLAAAVALRGPGGAASQPADDPVRSGSSAPGGGGPMPLATATAGGSPPGAARIDSSTVEPAPAERSPAPAPVPGPVAEDGRELGDEHLRFSLNPLEDRSGWPDPPDEGITPAHDGPAPGGGR